jgi:HK97 family phage major capsid protein
MAALAGSARLIMERTMNLKTSALSSVPASVLALVAAGVPDFLAFAHPIGVDAVIDGHRTRQQQLMEASTTILNRAEGENRELTEAERNEVDGLTREFDHLESEISLRERVAAQNAMLTAPRGRQTEADEIPGDDAPPPAPTARLNNAATRQPAAQTQTRVAAEPRVSARGTHGFRHLGDFANSVRLATMRQGGELDPRLRNAAASTYGNEGVGGDGGFAVPPDFRAEIMSKVFGEDSLIARTDRMQSSSNTLTMPIDMTTPWQTSGGIQSYWTAEAGTKQQSKPALEEVSVKLHTLATLVPVTEELLEDAPAMDTYLRRKVPEKMDFKLSDAIVRGSGAGQPLGFLNSPALVTVAAEGGQTADTIVAANIVKMWARMPAASRRTAVWLIHPDAEAQLPLMTIGNQPIYLPAGGVSASPFGTLFGRPVIPHQVAETVGDLADIMFVDLAQYLTVTKTGNGRDSNGMRTDVSIHLWFDQDMVAYRFTMRVAGQPWWSQATAQRDGSNAVSPFVVLAAR